MSQPQSPPSPEFQDKEKGSLSDETSSTSLTPDESNIAWWKVDLQVLPILTLLYLLNFMDRANIGNARVAGMQAQLKISPHNFSIALTILFIPFILVELPSNLVLKRLGAHNMLPAMAVAWGFVTAIQGIVTSYRGLIACRFFIGLFEGGLLPGIILYMSAFYPRRMLQVRISAFFASSALAGAFSGLLAAALVKLGGRLGRPGWAYIFIVEGGVTCGVGIISYFVMPRSPTQLWGLKETEVKSMQAVIAANGAQDEKFVWKEAFAVVYQPQVWMLFVEGFMGGMQLYAMAYFTPSIISGLGYSPTKTQLLSVGPLAAAWLVALATGMYADRFGQRGVSIVFTQILSIIGYSIYLTQTSRRLRYASLFFSVCGVYAAPSAVFAWVSNNSAGHYRRAVALALLLVGTNAGGILATWIFTAAPYRMPTIVCLVFSAVELVGGALIALYLNYLNNQKKKTPNSYPATDDRSSSYMYTL